MCQHRAHLAHRSLVERQGSIWLAAIALGACMLAAARAAEAHEPSAASGAPAAIVASQPSTPQSSPSALSSPSLLALPVVTPAEADASEPTLLVAAVAGDRYGSRGYYRPRYRGRDDYYRPERRRWHREPQGWLTVRGGFFDSEDIDKNDWTVGVKATAGVERYLQIGASVDLQRRSEAERTRIEEFRDETGNPVRTTVTTFEASSNLVPILGVLEVQVPSVGVRPYIGAGAGYEALVVEVNDFETGAEFTDDFGGFGWQGWAGLGVPIGRRAQLVAEGYLNRGTVSRTVHDIDTGARVKQEIDVDGGGFRGGVSFGF